MTKTIPPIIKKPRTIGPVIAKTLNVVPTDRAMSTKELNERYRLIEGCGEESRVTYQRLLRNLRILRHRGYIRSRYLEGSYKMVHQRNVVFDDPPQGQRCLKTAKPTLEDQQHRVLLELKRLLVYIETLAASIKGLSKDIKKYNRGSCVCQRQ